MRINYFGKFYVNESGSKCLCPECFHEQRPSSKWFRVRFRNGMTYICSECGILKQKGYPGHSWKRPQHIDRIARDGGFTFDPMILSGGANQ